MSCTCFGMSLLYATNDSFGIELIIQKQNIKHAYFENNFGLNSRDPNESELTYTVNFYYTIMTHYSGLNPSDDFYDFNPRQSKRQLSLTQSLKIKGQKPTNDQFIKK